MVERFCSHGALALRNASLVQRLHRMAATDGLTDIASRRTFEQTLDAELARAARSGAPVSLVMIGIDHFKLLNDAHGHPKGDEVTQRVAAIVKANCRSFDTPARYGGEEFGVILPGCDVEVAMVRAERLREAIADDAGDVSLTVSAGVATFPKHATHGDALVHAADAALYESKRLGRDRVTGPIPAARRRTRKKCPRWRRWVSPLLKVGGPSGRRDPRREHRDHARLARPARRRRGVRRHAEDARLDASRVPGAPAGAPGAWR